MNLPTTSTWRYFWQDDEISEEEFHAKLPTQWPGLRVTDGKALFAILVRVQPNGPQEYLLMEECKLPSTPATATEAIKTS